jgi:ribose transport system substrate-binding protein
VALDNAGLEAASEYLMTVEERPYLFGEGTSIKNVSYVDDGLITSMVVPNEYYMGYQSVAAITRRLDNRLTPMENETIAFRVVNRENLFNEASQRMLFPVVE